MFFLAFHPKETEQWFSIPRVRPRCGSAWWRSVRELHPLLRSCHFLHPIGWDSRMSLPRLFIPWQVVLWEVGGCLPKTLWVRMFFPGGRVPACRDCIPGR